MIDKLFDALVAQGSHVVLSSEGPLALQRSAALLLRRLLGESTVRVETEAPDDTQALLEHFNRIVDGMSVRQAMSAQAAVAPQGIILPVRVRADHAPARVTLLARLCKALPGADVRLLLIVEDQAAVRGCIKALGDRVVHGDIDPAEARHVPPPAARTQEPPPRADTALAPSAPDRASPRPSVASDTGPTPGEPAAAPPLASAAPPAPTLLARIGEQARLRPLRFALLVAGIPGALIALVLAVGIALAPKARPPAPPPAEPKGVAVPPPPVPAPAPTPPPVREGSRAAPDTKPVTPPPNPKPAAASPAGPAAAPAVAPAAAPHSATAPAKAATLTAPPASTAPAPASSAAPVATNASNASVTPPAVAAAPFACTPPSSPPPQLQPRNPSKDSGMVYLVSNTVQTVCVTDGSGSTVMHELTPDQGGRSFFGRAPWQLQSPGLREIQVFFQGSRINLPRSVSDRVELIER